MHVARDIVYYFQRWMGEVGAYNILGDCETRPLFHRKQCERKEKEKPAKLNTLDHRGHVSRLRQAMPMSESVIEAKNSARQSGATLQKGFA